MQNLILKNKNQTICIKLKIHETKYIGSVKNY